MSDEPLVNIFFLFLAMGFIVKALMWRSDLHSERVGRQEDNRKLKEQLQTLRSIGRTMELEHCQDSTLKSRQLRFMLEEEITEPDLYRRIVQYCQHRGIPVGLFGNDSWGDFREWVRIEKESESCKLQ